MWLGPFGKKQSVNQEVINGGMFSGCHRVMQYMGKAYHVAFTFRKYRGYDIDNYWLTMDVFLGGFLEHFLVKWLKQRGAAGPP